jgi:hypothetical protein
MRLYLWLATFLLSALSGSAAVLAAIEERVPAPFAQESTIVLVAAPIFTEDLALDAGLIVLLPDAGTITPIGVSDQMPVSLSPAYSVFVALRYSGLIPLRRNSYDSALAVLATAANFPAEEITWIRSDSVADALDFPAKPRDQRRW